jgi:hypothetical protein
LSVYVIDRNGSKCKYVEIFTHRHVGSTGTPSRRTVFVRAISAEQRKFPEIAGKNTKANIFYKGGARFEATVDLNWISSSVIIQFSFFLFMSRVNSYSYS